MLIEVNLISNYFYTYNKHIYNWGEGINLSSIILSPKFLVFACSVWDLCSENNSINV